MRATSPLHELQNLGNPVALSQPKYPVGTVIDIKRMDERSLGYFAKKVLREILIRDQTIIYRLQKQGYMTGMRGKKMLPGNKDQIRAVLKAMRTAHTVELAGCKPDGMHVTGTVGNQCYLQRGQCHSGVEFCYYLLFRSSLRGSEVVYIHPEPVLREGFIAELLLRSPTVVPTGLPSTVTASSLA